MFIFIFWFNFFKYFGLFSFNVSSLICSSCFLSFNQWVVVTFRTYLSGVLKCNIYVLLLLSESVTGNLISVQPCHNTRSSSMVTLAHPPTQSSLKVTNRSFQYAAPCLWNQLPTDLREPLQIQSPSLSPITHGSLSSFSSPFSLSLLASSRTCSVFHFELTTWLFRKSFPP